MRSFCASTSTSEARRIERDVAHRLEPAAGAAARAIAKRVDAFQSGAVERMRQHAFEAGDSASARATSASERSRIERHASVDARRRSDRRRRRRRGCACAATAPSAIAKTRSLGAGADRVHAGERAERGQHADVVAEPEARQAQVVEAAPAEADARMQVAGEDVGAAARPRVMAEREAVELERLVDDAHAEVGRRVAGAVVVVAAHEDELERRVLAPPARDRAERRRRVRARRMEEVAEEDDAARAPGRDQRRQRRQRLARRAARHRHAEGAKADRLADVRIGDEQRAAGGEERGLLGAAA